MLCIQRRFIAIQNTSNRYLQLLFAVIANAYQTPEPAEAKSTRLFLLYFIAFSYSFFGSLSLCVLFKFNFNAHFMLIFSFVFVLCSSIFFFFLHFYLGIWKIRKRMKLQFIHGIDCNFVLSVWKSIHSHNSFSWKNAIKLKSKEMQK